ncbi:MAG: hypothetical protein ABSA85_16195 [Terracidiphilus sp.]
MPKRKKPARTITLEVNRLRGKRTGALLQERTTTEVGRVIAYSLAHIDHRRCAVDNGRVLDHDDNHGYHHRHFMGKVEAVKFSTYPALVERFIAEVHELWRIEDEED